MLLGLDQFWITFSENSNMIWILTFMLCLGLMAALVAMTHPHLIEETIGKRWRNNIFYKRH
jgi:hypothetical protein